MAGAQQRAAGVGRRPRERGARAQGHLQHGGRSVVLLQGQWEDTGQGQAKQRQNQGCDFTRLSCAHWRRVKANPGC